MRKYVPIVVEKPKHYLKYEFLNWLGQYILNYFSLDGRRGSMYNNVTVIIVFQFINTPMVCT